MKRKTTAKENMLADLDKARGKGAEFICYAGSDDAVRIADAIDAISRLPDDLGHGASELARWYESDATGRRIVRTREIYGGLTSHQSGVIIWNGSADVFCGNWFETMGLPRSFGPPDMTGEGKKLLAIRLEREDLDEDTLELAFEAAATRGDRTPTISEVFRVNDLATIITFDGWP
jgi:hypothetical protein